MLQVMQNIPLVLKVVSGSFLRSQEVSRQQNQSLADWKVRSVFNSVPTITVGTGASAVSVVRVEEQYLNCGKLGWRYCHPQSGRQYLMGLDHRTGAIRVIATWQPRLLG